MLSAIEKFILGMTIRLFHMPWVITTHYSQHTIRIVLDCVLLSCLASYVITTNTNTSCVVGISVVLLVESIYNYQHPIQHMYIHYISMYNIMFGADSNWTGQLLQNSRGESMEENH